MEKESIFDKSTAVGKFLSRVKPIRVESLKKFLVLYYSCYVRPFVEAGKRQKPNLTKSLRSRRPRIYPGLNYIQDIMECSRATAQDYLRVMQITYDVFVKSEIQRRRILERIDKKDYDVLLRDLSRIFKDVAVRLESRKKGADTTILHDVRQSLNAISMVIKQAPGVLTPKDCAKIFEEFASWMI